MSRTARPDHAAGGRPRGPDAVIPPKAHEWQWAAVG